MSNGAYKEITKIVSALKRDGWSVEHSGRHPRVIAPNGLFVLFSTSPSDHNAHKSFARKVSRVQATLASCH